jgi:hypothetical protein
MKQPKNGSTSGFKFITFSPKLAVQKRVLYFGIIWLGRSFGYFSKNWVIFSKSSGHPGSQCRQSGHKIINL